MMDITRKLELVANLKPGQMWPAELGPELGSTNNWGTAISAICAEALAEIHKLRTHERERGVYFIETPENWLSIVHPPKTVEWSPIMPDNWTGIVHKPKIVEWSVVNDPEREQAEKTLIEAWGSPFAMNTENWK
jgi:hypothetical protein